MKTGKLFWELRKEFLTKEIGQIDSNIILLEEEQKRLTQYALNPGLTFREHQNTLVQLRANATEQSQIKRHLLHRKALLIECNKKLEIVARSPYGSYF